VTEQEGTPLEFTVRRVLVARLAEWAVTAVPSGHVTLPVYACFRVDIAPGKLHLTGANGERVVRAATQAVSTEDTGTLYLPARTLRQILSEAPEGEVRFRKKGSFTQVSAGGAHWDLKMPGAENYHELPDLDSAGFQPVDRESLLSALKTVRHAAGRDASRPQYAQVSMAADEGVMYASAADSSQYSRAPLPGFPFAAGIPVSVLDDLLKLLADSKSEQAHAAEAGNDLVFRVDSVTLAVRKLDKPFPDTREALAEARANEDVLEADRTELQQAIRRVRITTDALTSAIALVLDDSSGHGTLTVQSRDKGGNASQETIRVSWSGGHRMVLVSGQFLAAMLAAHPVQTCSFRVGRDRGKQRRRSPLLLEDAEAGVTGTIPTMPPELGGY
jgi:DNA polymerase III sliding clamp (beta) subunit (PCNA family)